MNIGNNPPLRQAAVKASEPIKRCESGKSCSCNDYPRRMHAFRELAKPQAIICMFEMLDLEQAVNRRTSKARRHVTEAIRYLGVQPCTPDNCGTVCLCPPCHARKALEILDPEWNP